ncbi:MAG: AAA family ATPase [Metamycoplasmataceae bacterium]
MEISVKKAWDELVNEFDINKAYHIYSLAIIIRNILEEKRESKIPFYVFDKDKNEKRNMDYDDVIKNNEMQHSVLHNLLHFNSINTSPNLLLKSILNFLLIINSEDYQVNDIIQKIYPYIKKEVNIFDISSEVKYLNKDKKEYILKIFNFDIVSYNPLYILYSGKRENKNDDNILFFSKKVLEVNSVYDLTFNYFKFNKKPFFILFDYKSMTQKIKNKILQKYQTSSGEELFSKLGNIFPYSINDENLKEREIILDICNYFGNPFKIHNNSKSLFPFLEEPFFKKTKNNIDFKWEKKIIENYKYYSYMLVQYKFKKILDYRNKYYEKIEDEENKQILLKQTPGRSNLFVEEDGNIYFLEYYNEIKLFRNIFKKIQPNKIYSNIINNNITKNICDSLINQKTVIITGPAGTGKSTKIKEIIDLYRKNNQRVCLICLTYKALSVYDDLGKKIKQYTYQHIENNNDLLLEFDLVIIDEFSMIPNWKFLDKIQANETRILIAGDSNQLQPINSNVKKYKWLFEEAEKYNKNIIFNFEKEENKRCSNKTLQNIQNKLLSKEFNYKNNNDFNEKIYIFDNKKDAIKKITELSNNDYKIITKRNSGVLGVDFLNRYLSKRKDSKDFSVGNEIIFIKTEKQYIDEQNYHKGLIGKIEEINEKEYIIKINFDEYKSITKNSTNNLPFIHYLVMSAHKAQGTTIEKVVVIVERAPMNSKNLDFEWLYTAFSRASEDAIIIFCSE